MKKKFLKKDIITFKDGDGWTAGIDIVDTVKNCTVSDMSKGVAIPMIGNRFMIDGVKTEKEAIKKLCKLIEEHIKQ